MGSAVYRMASMVSRLYIEIILHKRGQDNFLPVLCDSQAPVAWKQEHEKESWTQDTLDTDGHSALNMIWFDQIGGGTTQDRKMYTMASLEIFSSDQELRKSLCQSVCPFHLWNSCHLQAIYCYLLLLS